MSFLSMPKLSWRACFWAQDVISQGVRTVLEGISGLKVSILTAWRREGRFRAQDVISHCTYRVLESVSWLYAPTCPECTCTHLRTRRQTACERLRIVQSHVQILLGFQGIARAAPDDPIRLKKIAQGISGLRVSILTF